MSVADRAALLEANDTLYTGIDFVQVVDPLVETRLRLYLVTDARRLSVPFAGTKSLKPENFRIESVTDPNLPQVRVLAISTLSAVDDSQVLPDPEVPRVYIEIDLEKPGEFGRYKIHIDDPSADPSGTAAPFSRFDPFFNDVEFSFKAGCETFQDCLPPVVDCPPDPAVDFPIDYLARDFVSIRNALLDFAAQRYPQWTLPIEADVGMMLAEVMSAMGDEFAYMQDRHAREAFLETASERRSLRKKARLLDFEIHDGRSAATLLELTIDPANPPTTGNSFVTAGMRLWAPSESRDPIPFEIGLGLFDRETNGQPTHYPVLLEWNADRLEPYWFDDSQICLPIGATELVIAGKLDPDTLLRRALLLRTDPEDRSLPARRHFVTILQAQRIVDPLSLSPSIDLIRVSWSADQALPFQIDQQSLSLSLNIVPATAGETLEQRFIRGSTFEAGFLSAVEREGPFKLDESPRQPVVLLGLPDTETLGLGFLGDRLRNTRPEIEVIQIDVAGNEGDSWSWVRSLLSESEVDEVFTLEDGVWRRIRAFRRAGDEFVHRDYATGAGYSVRFGDGEFGLVPDEDARFKVRYRTGPGAQANVPEGAVHLLRLPGVTDNTLPGFVLSATNPLPVTSGVDPETAREVKQLVPQAFQSGVLFAVTPDDYSEQAEKLDFVQRANGVPRWTGSWQSMFVAADPFGSSSLTDAQHDQLRSWLDCVRQVGREVIVRDPKTVPIDLTVTVCVEPFAYAGQVAAQVQELLIGSGVGGRPKGFFHPDNFSFGVPLRRSALEAVIQSVPGVRGVRDILVRLRGVRQVEQVLTLTLPVASDQILRLDNDPLHPEAGSLTIKTQGGA